MANQNAQIGNAAGNLLGSIATTASTVPSTIQSWSYPSTYTTSIYEIRKDALGLCTQLGKWSDVEALISAGKRLERFLTTGE